MIVPGFCKKKSLSQRNLHAVDDEFVRQCASSVESEDGSRIQCLVAEQLHSQVRIEDNKDVGSSRDKDEDYYLHKRWWKWIDDYVNRKLRHPSDQYAAFAGIIQHFQDLTGSEAVLRLWKRYKPLHLTWSVSKKVYRLSEITRTTTGTRQPSWIWITFPRGQASVNNRTFSNYREVAGKRLVFCADILDVQVQWTETPWTSIPTGRIKLRSRVDSLSLESKGSLHGLVRFLDYDVSTRTSIKVKRKGTIRVITLFSGRLDYLIDGKNVLVEYLVIRPAGAVGNGEYIRIGQTTRYFYCDPDKMDGWQPPGIMMDITLV
jgi:hypothetical protein